MAEKRARMKKPELIASLLDSVFTGKPVQKRLREIKVWQVWEEAVGSQIASKARPAGIGNGILVVKVASSPWMQQLSLMKPDIIHQLNMMAGEPLVTDIIFKSGRVDPLPGKSSVKKESCRVLSEEESAWITEQASIIADPELRQSFCTLITRHLTSSGGST